MNDFDEMVDDNGNWLDDDSDDFDDDPNRCPDCGGDIDAEGYCTMMECGYSINDDILFDDDDDTAALSADDATPADGNGNEVAE